MAIRLDLQVGLERTQMIAVVDLCRPSYVHPEQLRAAAIQKQDDCGGLDYYTGRGWTVHVFPWVVDIRGLFDPSHIHSLLES